MVIKKFEISTHQKPFYNKQQFKEIYEKSKEFFDNVEVKVDGKIQNKVDLENYFNNNEELFKLQSYHYGTDSFSIDPTAEEFTNNENEAWLYTAEEADFAISRSSLDVKKVPINENPVSFLHRKFKDIKGYSKRRNVSFVKQAKREFF